MLGLKNKQNQLDIVCKCFFSNFAQLQYVLNSGTTNKWGLVDTQVICMTTDKYIAVGLGTMSLFLDVLVSAPELQNPASFLPQTPSTLKCSFANPHNTLRGNVGGRVRESTIILILQM